MVKPFPFRSFLIVFSCFVLSFSAWAQGATAPTKISSSEFQFGTCKVNYTDSGINGIPVVFLHGGYGDSKIWKNQLPAFTAAGYRFIAIDYRNACISNTAQNNDYAANLINQLTNKLGIQKFHLLGTASGAVTAVKYALSNRDKLRSLILSHSIGNVQDQGYAEINARLRPVNFNQIPLEIRELGPSYRAANPEGVKTWLSLGNENRSNTAQPRDSDGGMNPKSAGRTDDMGAGRNPADAVTWSNLEGLKVPILIMTGDADLYTPPSVLRIFTSHIKRAEFAIIPESGHSSFWENPDIFNRTVLAFISKY